MEQHRVVRIALRILLVSNLDEMCSIKHEQGMRLKVQVKPVVMMLPRNHQAPRTLTRYRDRHQGTLQSTQGLSPTRCGDARLIRCIPPMQLWL